MQEVRSLEVSYEQKTIFLGGGLDDDDGVAKVISLTFNRNLKKTGELIVKPQNMNCVYSMTRTEKGNVLFLGGFGSCSVVYFDSNSCKFQTLNTFEDIMNDEISDLKFFKESLFMISIGHEEIAKITFISGRESQSSVVNLSAPRNLISIFGSYLESNFTLEGKINFNS